MSPCNDHPGEVSDAGDIETVELLRKALEFYALGEHWMSLGSDSPHQMLLVAGGRGELQGWAVAREALAEFERRIGMHLRDCG